MAKLEDSQIHLHHHHHHHHHHVRIRIKGPSPPPVAADDHSNNKNNVQRFCKKAFTSVYALNGHTRIHSDKANLVAAKTDNNNVKTCDGKPSCRNPFPSSKSLLTRRETTPCQKIWSGCRFNIAAAMVAPYGDDDMFCHSSSVAEHSDGSVFRSWPLFCKRIRKPRLSGRRRRAISCSEVEVDPLMQEAAYTLMLLANSGDLCGDQAKFSSTPEEQGNSTKRMKT